MTARGLMKPCGGNRCGVCQFQGTGSEEHNFAFVLLRRKKMGANFQALKFLRRGRHVILRTKSGMNLDYPHNLHQLRHRHHTKQPTPPVHRQTPEKPNNGDGATDVGSGDTWQGSAGLLNPTPSHMARGRGG